jgi:hypothetical protein
MRRIPRTGAIQQDKIIRKEFFGRLPGATPIWAEHRKHHLHAELRHFNSIDRRLSLQRIEDPFVDSDAGLRSAQPLAA